MGSECEWQAGRTGLMERWQGGLPRRRRPWAPPAFSNGPCHILSPSEKLNGSKLGGGHWALLEFPCAWRALTTAIGFAQRGPTTPEGAPENRVAQGRSGRSCWARLTACSKDRKEGRAGVLCPCPETACKDTTQLSPGRYRTVPRARQRNASNLTEGAGPPIRAFQGQVRLQPSQGTKQPPRPDL